ncbi:MAG: hypothetical protein HUJ63_00180 [Enterococcus sp.]|nr:hypothetical protein [Enterococcus sp.]
MRVTWKVSAFRGAVMPVRSPLPPPSSGDTQVVSDWAKEIVEASDAYFLKLRGASSPDGRAATEKGLKRSMRWNDWVYVRMEVRQVERDGAPRLWTSVTYSRPSRTSMRPKEVEDAARDVAVAVAQVVVAKSRLVFEKEPKARGYILWEDGPVFDEAIRRDNDWLERNNYKRRETE